MNSPRAHRFYLKMTGYPLEPGLRDQVTPREERMLIRYGYWLEALAAGKIPPCTEAQQRFVLVSQGHGEPQSRFEIAWLKWMTLTRKVR